MEDESDVVDWGNEEDEQQPGYLQDEGREDVEDAVSLGGDEDDTQDFPASNPRASPEIDWTTSASSPHQTNAEGSSLQSGYDRDFAQSNHATESPLQSRRSQSSSFGQLTHALPPKPVLVAPDYVRPAPPQASTLAGRMVQRDRRSNGHSKDDGHSLTSPDSLPPDWEIRYSKNGGREAYYYNTKTHDSTWTRPVAMSGGGSSPSKDREYSSARSPRLNALDRSQNSDRNSSTRGRKQRRRGSPNTLTFDDRHYRPGEVATSAPVSDGHEVARPRPRQPSPVSVNGRPRSLTPPPREADRSGIARRQYSRSPPPTVHGTWREPQRGAPQARLSSSLDRERGWARGGNNVSAEVPRSASPDGRAQRGRRPHDLPRPHTAHLQDRSDRRGDSRDWPSVPHRYRSPEQDVDTRSKQNRNAQGWDSWQANPQSGRNRPLSPPTPERGPVRPRNDAYIPLDSVPLRRGRELVSPDRGGDTETKRRRLEGRSSNILPDRRPLSVERGLPPSASLPEQPLSDLTLSEEPRRKRAPLPPQSTRFRQASKMPPPLTLPIGSLSTMAPSSSTPYPTPRSGPDSATPARFAAHSAHSYVDVPSGPRNAAPQAGVREFDSARGPSSRPSGRPSRFDSAPQISTSYLGPSAKDRDQMDVDLPPTSALPHGRTVKTFTAAVRPSPNDIPDTTPRAPKAMIGNNSKPLLGDLASSAPSSATSDIGRTPSTPLLPPSALREGHIMQDREARFLRHDDLPPKSAHASTTDVPSRVYDDAREYMPDASSTRTPVDSLPRDSRGGRDNYRRPDIVPQRGKISGSNNTPIGSRRAAPNGPPMEPPQRSRSPVESYRPPPDQANHDRYDGGHSRYSGEAPSQHTPPRDSPGSGYRPLPPLSDARHALPASVPLPTFQAPALDAAPRRGRHGDRLPRQTRFGSEHKTPSVPDSEPRIWLTREESEQVERARQAVVASTQPPVPHDESSLSRRVSMDVDEPPRRRESPERVKGNTPPRHVESNHYDRRPTLEGRLSSTYDPPPNDLHSRSRVKADTHRDYDRRDYRDSKETQHFPQAKLYPERARLLEQHAADFSSSRELESSRGGKGFGRRHQRDDLDEPLYPAVQGNGHAADDDSHESDRPLIKRGTSLLERLSGGASGSSAQTTLRDRVDSPTKLSLESEAAGLPPKPVSSGGDDGDDLSGRGRIKKKGGKARRGRKGGAA